MIGANRLATGVRARPGAFDLAGRPHPSDKRPG
jgi:hypothetical protein